MENQELLSSMYMPLPHERCTRLLQMLGSTPEDNEKLHLEMSILDMNTIPASKDDTARLHRHRGYDALSYTWGPPLYTSECEKQYSPLNDVPVTVQLEGRPTSTKIGRNLYEALLHIWETGRRRPIWIDALCINQQDLVEKASHILLMGDIYSRADLVLVWLGRDDPDLPTFDHILWLHTTVLDDILRNNTNDIPLTRERINVHMNGHEAPDGVKLSWAENDVIIPDAPLRSLYRFYARRRYLSRAWVVQEIALSRDAWALIGKKGLPFERLAALVNTLKTSDLNGIASNFIEDFHNGNTGDGSELHSLMTSLRQRENYKAGGVMRNDLAKLYGSHDEVTLFLAAMEYNITVLNWRRATDCRDLFYALLGMVRFSIPIEDVPLHPDYTKPQEEIFHDFTTQSLLKLPHRTILSLVRHDETLKLTEDNEAASRSPSWVPDFANPDAGFTTLQTLQSALWQSPTEFTAGFDKLEFSLVEVNGSELKIFGRRCASVVHTFKPVKPGPDPTTYSEHLLRDLSLVACILEECVALDERHASGESNVEIMFRILTDEALDLQSSQERRDRCKNLLCMTVVETECLFSDHGDLITKARRIRELLPPLEGHPGIPILAELERFKTTFAAVQQYGTRDYDDIAREIQTAWPEKKIVLDDGEIDSDALVLVVRSMQKRADIRLHHDHVIFNTENKYLGRALSHVQVGDQLWLICQAQVPFILRPTSNGTFLLVGETFVHGAMFGELIKNGVAEDPQLITIV